MSLTMTSGTCGMNVFMAESMVATAGTTVEAMAGVFAPMATWLPVMFLVDLSTGDIFAVVIKTLRIL